MKLNFPLSFLCAACFAAACVFPTGCSDSDDVQPVAVSEVTLDSKALRLSTGQTARLKATVLPEDADYEAVIFSSDAPAVATVDAEGVVTAVAVGTAQITAQAGGRTATCKVTVYAEVTEVRLKEPQQTLYVGETVQLTPSVVPENAEFVGFEFESDTPAVATVDADGIVTAVKAGTARVTVYAGGKSAVCEVTVREKAQTVYAAGYSDALMISYWWKNGQINALGTTSQNTRTHAIHVADSGDVYIGGEYTDDSLEGYLAAVLWKNGTPTLLTDMKRPTDAAVYAIDTEGADVWAAGFFRHPKSEAGPFQRDIATLWKNGKEIRLTDGSNYAKAWDVHVAAGKVYAVGEATNADGFAVATMWVNGNTSDDWSGATATNLSDGTNHAYAEAMCVDGADVYVAGNSYRGSDQKRYAAYWKNGAMSYLSDLESYAVSVCVSGGHVYVAGWEYVMLDGRSCAVATLWVDGVPQHLTNEKKSSQARCVVVKSGNVYVSGFLGDVATIWKNGEPQALSDGTYPTGITSLFVTEQ